MARVGGNGAQRLGCGTEQDRIDDGLVVEGDLGERCRQGEDEMEIGDGQQLGLPRGQSRSARRAPRLRGGRLWRLGQCRLRQEL